MSYFNAKYLTDQEIWFKIQEIIDERDKTELLLAEPQIHSDQVKMPELARRLQELNEFAHDVAVLRECLVDLEELEQILVGEVHTDSEQDEMRAFYEEYGVLCAEKAGIIYSWLLDRGYLNEEIEDETDLGILRFIDYAGPEYAWRLGINLGMDVEESRSRLDNLLEKGLLERVEGKMLGNYHREKGWTKHMNHTYYKITREGRLYLRSLRRDDD